MNIAVGFACLVAMVVTAGVTGLPEQQLAVGEQLDDYDDDFLERKGNGGCGTRMFCGIAGGRCQSKDDVCDGELRTNKFYCKGGKKCGCCIPRGPPGCVFGFKSYEDGAIIEDVCMQLQCMKGNWKYLGTVRHECGECQAFGDPHMFTFDNHTAQITPHYYLFNDSGIFTVTQGGLDKSPEYGLSASMELCWYEETCVRSINYFEPGLEINITLPTFNYTNDDGWKHGTSDCYPWSGEPNNDPECAIKIYLDEKEYTLGNSMESFYARDGTVLLFNHNHKSGGNYDYGEGDDNIICINIVGSKGLSMSFCMSTMYWYSNLYVWASPTLRGDLYGLCDTYTGGVRDGYTMQNGSLTCNDTELFGSTWKTGENEHSGPSSPSVEEVTYRAAVLEYESYSEWTEEGGMGIVRENAKIIAEYLAQAKAQGVDIMVAPEYGIQGTSQRYSLLNNSDFRTLMMFLPEPAENAVPCDLDMGPEHFEALQILSCAAQANQAYLVAALGELVPCSNQAHNPFNIDIDTTRWCPPGGYHFYNTQIVLDRTGALIAKYHKKNLFLEPAYTPGDQPDEAAIFTTDFGITFTLQICFDIAYYHPGVSNVDTYGIKDVVMSTSWVDMLPCNIADVVQNAWSRGLGVNLMVSGQHYPEKGKVGSGIYRNFYDLAVNYTYDADSGNKMIVSDVVSSSSAPITVANNEHYTKKRDMLYSEEISLESKSSTSGREHFIIWDDLSNYTGAVLEKGEGLHVQACHMDELCCELTYDLSSDLIYMLAAYSGTVEKGFGEYNIYTQICGVLWCTSADDINTCTHFEDGLPDDDEIGPFALSGNMKCEKTYSAVFHRDLLLVDNSLYDFTHDDDGVYTIQTFEATPNLMTAGLQGRWYSRDPQ